MLARCPACRTVFRVAPHQLAARDGRVRCGHCLNAFDAVLNAVEETSSPQAVDAPQAPPFVAPLAPEAPGSTEEFAKAEAVVEPASPAPAAVTLDVPADALPAAFRARADRSDSGSDNSNLTEPKAPPVEAGPTDYEIPGSGVPEEAAAGFDTGLCVAAEEPQAPFVDPATAPASTEASAAAVQAVGDADHESAAKNETEGGTTPDAAPPKLHIPAASIPVPPPALASREPPQHRRVWGIALGALGMALAVQSLLLLRQPLTRALPALREPLVALCQRLGCELPLPREAAEISIEASDLHPEPGGQGDFVLHAMLRNRAAFPQALPYMELSLTDAADKPVVRRVFAPAEWTPGSAPDAVFGPGASAEVALPFNAAGVAAVGYRVYAFYP